MPPGHRLLKLALALIALSLGALCGMLLAAYLDGGRLDGGGLTLSNSSRLARCLEQEDRLVVEPEGPVRWQRLLRIANEGRRAASQFVTRLPALDFLPFDVAGPLGRPLEARGSLDREGLLLTISLDPPLGPGRTLHVVLVSRARGLVRAPYPGASRARLELPVSWLTREVDRYSLSISLPRTDAAGLSARGPLWDSVANGPLGSEVVWRSVPSLLPASVIGLEFPASVLGVPPLPERPFEQGRLRFALVLLFGLGAALAFAAWRASPRWHETILAGVMALQFVLFFQPMLLEDNMAYLAYARSILWDGDLDLGNDYLVYNAYSIFAPKPAEPPGPTGASLMLAPFVAAGGLLRWAAGLAGWTYPANGFSWPYLAAVGTGSFLYAFGSLLLCYRMAAQLVAPRPALAATLAVATGTNLFLVTFFWTASTHAPSAFLVTSFIYVWWRSREGRSPAVWALLGLVGGLATQTRYQNGLLLALPAVDLLTWPSGPRGRLRDALGSLGLYAAGAMLGASFQVIVWALLEGSPIVDNYGVGRDRFSFLAERFWKLLLGRGKSWGADGLLTGMPLLGLAWLSLLAHWRRLTGTERWLGLFLAGQLAVVASYETYWGKLLYGSAYLVNCSVVAVLGLAWLLRSGRRLGVPRLVLAGLLAVGSVWHLGLEVKQQAFEQLSFPGGTSLAEKLTSLWLLPSSIELGYLRTQSSNFGHPVRELLTPGGEFFPCVLLLASAALGMALAIRTRPGRGRAVWLAGFLAAYLVLADAAGVAAALRGRAATGVRLFEKSSGAVHNLQPVRSATGPWVQRAIGPGSYRTLVLITHLIEGNGIAQGAVVARLQAKVAGQPAVIVPLLAGVDTADAAALRPETRSGLKHGVPWSRVVHQWRTRDGSAHYYWGCSYAVTVPLPPGPRVESLEVQPVSTDCRLAVTDVVLLGQAASPGSSFARDRDQGSGQPGSGP